MPSTVDPREFRNTLGRFATGVTVVTMVDGSDVHGITVNAFMSVSLKPPLVLISIDARANAHATLMEGKRYGVSVLRHDQDALSNHFAGAPGDVEPRFVDLDGLPVIDGAIAQIACTIEDRVDAGDHTLFVGRVDALTQNDGDPLLYYQGSYGALERD